jgi:hypothetical protein
MHVSLSAETAVNEQCHFRLTLLRHMQQLRGFSILKSGHDFERSIRRDMVSNSLSPNPCEKMPLNQKLHRRTDSLQQPLMTPPTTPLMF